MLHKLIRIYCPLKGNQFLIKEDVCATIHPGFSVEILGETICVCYLKHVGEPVYHTRQNKHSHFNYILLWHKRLGHRNLQSVQRLLQKRDTEMTECDQIQVCCEICLKAKETALGYKRQQGVHK